MSTYNRAQIIDDNFVRAVIDGDYPEPRSSTNWSGTELTREGVLALFESQIISRHLDLIARKLKSSNQCFYTIGSSGHEGNAVFGKVFRLTDMAFLHYRSGALMVERSRKLPESNCIRDTLLSLVASSDDPIAGGRHKVWGSLPMLVPPQTSTIASHLPKAMGVALSISRARDLRITPALAEDSVVLCSFGDASVNHSTALGAINTAIWTAYQNVPMPIVFICEDNQIGISVPTPGRWIESQYSTREGLSYVAVDGLNLFDLYCGARKAEEHARTLRKPVFLHMKTIRLLGHAGSDVEQSYHSLARIEDLERQDPLLHSARLVTENGMLSSGEIVQLYRELARKVEKEASEVIARPKLETAEQVRSALIACRNRRVVPVLSSASKRRVVFATEFEKLRTPQHMAKLINWGLRDILLRYDNTLLFGQDVAQNGGVYNVTDGLYRSFGAKRVFNSLLDEQSILGTAIGMAHNGFIPIPEVQFLAYVHNAEDQIRGEAATLAFFSQGQFTNPMVIRVAGLAYQKGFGGHFHNDNSLAVLRDIPGLIVGIPSNGADAVRMMRTCVRQAQENGRVCILIEPIALYMTKDLHEPGDRGWSFIYPSPEEEISLGEFQIYGDGEDLTILTYGNGLFYSLQAQQDLLRLHGVNIKVIDLRWMAPLDETALVFELQASENVFIVEECRKTGSWSEALVALMVERMTVLPDIEIIAADDCFIPLGRAATAGLPGKEDIVRCARDMVGKMVTSNLIDP